VTLYLEQ